MESTSPSKKRLLEETVSQTIERGQHAFTMPISPQSLDSKNNRASATLPDGTSRQASPALSITSSLTSVSVTPDPSGASTLNGAPPAKRRKLTFVERERKQKERADKQAKADEEKRTREELKLVKDEERRIANEEKEEKRRKKELEAQEKAQAKEEIKRKKEEEILKKTRAQPRIFNFFAKPKLPANQQESAVVKEETHDSTSNPSPKPSVGTDTLVPVAVPPEPTAFEQSFLPFELPSHAVCAPSNLFSWDRHAVAHLEKTLEAWEDAAIPVASLAETLYSPLVESSPSSYTTDVRSLISQITAPGQHVIDLTKVSSNSTNPLTLLQGLPLRYIDFYQDVRPPYRGTHTKLRSRRDRLKLTRNPVMRSRPELDYDYDSEAEWQEPEEGDDVESNAESDDEGNSAADPEEMDDFLDDEETGEGAKNKRKLFTSDMKPICSGICWEGPQGDQSNDHGWAHDPKEYKMEVIQEHHKLPIDPFSTAYWLESLPTIHKISTQNAASPRLPLQARPNGASATLTNFLGSPAPQETVKAKQPKAVKQNIRLLDGEDLAAFKVAVEGSELKKVGLLSVLKTQFPKVPNEVLKDTLNTCAQRVGAKEADKRWRVIETS